MPRSVRRSIYVGIAGLLVAAALLSGCSSLATRQGFYEKITPDVEQGNYDQAIAKLETALEDGKYAEKDRLIYFVDAGMLNHYAGDYEASNQKLHVAEAAADELFTKSISRAALSVALNDNVLEYPGEDYEILYIHLIKALNFIAMDDFDGAFVEVRRVNERLDILERKYADAALEMQRGLKKDTTHNVQLDYTPERVRFYNSAFARYLSMHMYAAEGLYDDARIDYDFLVEAFEQQPYVYDFPLPQVKYLPEDTGTSIVSVVALAGLGPTKESFALRLRTDKQLNLVQILTTDTDGKESEYAHVPMPVSEDFYFKFAIPRVEPKSSRVAYARFLVNLEPVGELQLLEETYRVAEETFRAKKSLILLRSIARAVAKGIAAHKLKKDVDDGGLGGWLKKAAVDVGMDLTENADIRSTKYLPGRVFVGDFELPAGRYDLTIEFYTADNILIERRHFEEYQVLPRGLNLIEAAATY